MRSDDVVERVKAKLAELGVPRHLVHVRKVPSSVRVELFVRNSLWLLDLRKGITAWELDNKLSHLTSVWDHARPSEQVDLEDAIKAKR
jgi:hypothetical protein